MRVFSPEYKEFSRTGLCRSCRRPLRVDYFQGDTKVGWLQSMSAVWSAASLDFGCRNCGVRWTMMTNDSYTSTPVFTPGGIVETSRSEEPIGDEVRRVDNSASSVTLTRRLTISKRWLRICEIQSEQVDSSTTGIELGLDTIGKVTASSETALTRHYSLTNETERTHTEEIELSVPARTAVEVRLRWKRLWQHGVVRMRNGQGATLNVPFRVAIGLTFDQTNRDL